MNVVNGADNEEVAANVAAPAPEGKTRVWWLGGASLAVRTPRACLWVDPFFGQPARPKFHLQHPPLVDPNEAAPVTAVLITHEHNDHCHSSTLMAFSAHQSFVTYAPDVTVAKVRKEAPNLDVKAVDPGFTGEVADVKFTVFSGNDSLAEKGFMYLLDTPGGRVLHPGDSLHTPGFFAQFAHHNIDVSCFSVGGLLFGEKAYMEPKELGLAAEELRARKSIPVHWDLWEEAKLDPDTVEDWGTSSIHLLNPGGHIELR